MEKTTEELTIENENLKQGNIKVWEQLEKSTEILSHHEAYISLLEEENTKFKELLESALSWFPDSSKLRGGRYAQLQNLKRKIKEVLK